MACRYLWRTLPPKVVFRTTPQTNKIEIKEYLLKLYAPKVEHRLADGTVSTTPDKQFFGKVNTINGSGKTVQRMTRSKHTHASAHCARGSGPESRPQQR